MPEKIRIPYLYFILCLAQKILAVKYACWNKFIRICVFFLVYAKIRMFGKSRATPKLHNFFDHVWFLKQLIEIFYSNVSALFDWERNYEFLFNLVQHGKGKCPRLVLLLFFVINSLRKSFLLQINLTCSKIYSQLTIKFEVANVKWNFPTFEICWSSLRLEHFWPNFNKYDAIKRFCNVNILS